MKKILGKLVGLLYLVGLVGNLNAQTDSVWVEGRVIDAASGQPQTACEVQLLQEGAAKAVSFCDEAGYYSIGWMPKGSYTLSILSGGASLYFAEIQLTESIMMNIALMPDTVNLRALEPVTVNERKHMLGEKLITSADDPRLWNFSGVEALMDAGPASEDRSWPTLDGRNPFWSSGLRSWRPAWLDAPWTVLREEDQSEESSEEEIESSEE